MVEERKKRQQTNTILAVGGIAIGTIALFLPRSTGVAGPPGVMGPAGTPGAPGADGSMWFNGAGVPGAGLGIDGDYYIDTGNGDYYQKVLGVWTLLGNLTGPQGAMGLPGAPGAGWNLFAFSRTPAFFSGVGPFFMVSQLIPAGTVTNGIVVFSTLQVTSFGMAGGGRAQAGINVNGAVTGFDNLYGVTVTTENTTDYEAYSLIGIDDTKMWTTEDVTVEIWFNPIAGTIGNWLSEWQIWMY